LRELVSLSFEKLSLYVDELLRPSMRDG
jgi:hypothetical protein